MSHTDFISRQAINGGSLDSVLMPLKGEHEDILSIYSSDVARKRSDLSACQAELCDVVVEEGRIEFSPCIVVYAIKAKELSARHNESEREFAAFKNTHNITRPPLMPNPVEGMAQICALTVIETIGGAIFLGNAHMTSGPITAVIVSLLISVTSMSLSVAGGYFAGRYLGYGSAARD